MATHAVRSRLHGRSIHVDTSLVKGDLGFHEPDTYFEYKVTGAKACPWCDGSGQYVRDAGLEKVAAVIFVECGYCVGTGLRSKWNEHPEKARQLADERLTKFPTVTP